MIPDILAGGEVHNALICWHMLKINVEDVEGGFRVPGQQGKLFLFTPAEPRSSFGASGNLCK